MQSLDDFVTYNSTFYPWNMTTLQFDNDVYDNGTNNTDLEHWNQFEEWYYSIPWWRQMIWTLLFVGMITVAIGGNLIVIWIVLAHRRMHTVTNYFLVNLSIADAMMATLNGLVNFIYVINNYWLFGTFYCKISDCIAVLTIYASVFTLMAISIDRFPRDINKKNKWLKVLNLENYDPPKTAAICSDFKEENYEQNNLFHKLKKDAIPHNYDDNEEKNKCFLFNNMPSYKLIYFLITAMAEPIRFLFNYAGIEFEDKRVPKADWPQFKLTMLFGKMPVLVIDRKMINQSVAISRYLAKQCDRAGKNDMESLEIDTTVDTIYDLNLIMRRFHYERNEQTKEEKRKIVKEMLPFYLKRLDAQVKKNGGYFVGGALSWADFIFVSLLEFFNLMMKTNIIEEYENLKQLQEKVEEISAIKRWIEKRPASLWPPQTA